MESLSRDLYLYQYMQVIQTAFNNDKTFKLDIVGNSMAPTLVEGDSVVLDKPLNIKKGDIILYRSGEKEYSLHRIKKVGDVIKVVGDNNIIVENILEKFVVAKVIQINKKDKVIKRNSIKYLLDSFYANTRRFFRRVKNKVTNK